MRRNRWGFAKGLEDPVNLCKPIIVIYGGYAFYADHPRVSAMSMDNANLNLT